jgi:hypothetical protein
MFIKNRTAKSEMGYYIPAKRRYDQQGKVILIDKTARASWIVSIASSIANGDTIVIKYRVHLGQREDHDESSPGKTQQQIPGEGPARGEPTAEEADFMDDDDEGGDKTHGEHPKDYTSR